MNVAELFINLGVKGDGTAQKSLQGVKSTIGEIGTAAIASKAAVLGVIYGLERLTGSAAERGMELQQFTAATGLSADALQRWQNVGMKFGVSAGEVESSIKGIQNAMTGMVLEGANPKAMRLFEEAAGGFNPARLRDTWYVMGKIQTAMKNLAPDMRRYLAPSLGIGDNMGQFLANMDMNDLAKVPKSQLLGEGEIKQLARIDAAWNKLWNTMKLFGEHKVSQYGMEGVQTMARAFQTIVDASKALQSLTKEFPQVAAAGIAAGAAIGAAWAPLTATVIAITGLLSEYQLKKEGKPNIFGEGKLAKDIPGSSIGANIMDFLSGSEDTEGTFANYLFKKNHFLNGDNEREMLNHPALNPGRAPQSSAQPVRSEINQTLIFSHDGQNHQDNARSHRDAAAQADHAVRSSPVLAGGY